MSDDVFPLWVYLSTTPLLWLTVTLVAWIFSDWLAAKFNRHPLVNPILLAVILVSLVLVTTDTSYATFFEGAQFVHFMLGPATVAIAIPIVKNRKVIAQNLIPLLAALLVGGFVAVISVILIGKMLGLPHDILISLAPKSVTAGVAMGISEQLGGVPSLTAVVVITTGIFGAIIVTPLMNLLGIKDYVARGFAVGLSAHGIGTARAFNVSPIAGTFAGIALGLNAVITAFIVPFMVGWLI